MSTAVTGATTEAMGKYQLIVELGRGGMAEVFLARASGPAGFNKLVVVKQIRPQFAEDPEFLNMFLDEGRLAARLNHPNVVQTNEVGEDAGRYFICMEYLEGQPLNRVLSRLGERAPAGARIGLRTQILVLVEVLAGLHHAHELCDYDGTPLAVVHRDMSPHNVFVTYAGQVKIVDFGIAKALSSSSETRTGVLKGKVGYMAPEQAMGDKVDRRADIFSVGMILWEMLTGHRMFKGMPDVAILQRMVNGDLPSPRVEVPSVPARLEAICMKALARDRDARYATAAEMAADLEAALDELDGKASLRDLGKLLEKHFEGERARLKALIEAAYAGARTFDEGTEGGRRSGTGSGPRARIPVFESPSTDAATRREVLADGRAAEPTTGAGTGPGTGTGTRPSVASPSSLTVGSTAASLAPPPGRSRVALLAVAASVVGAGLAATFFLTRTPEPPKPAPARTAEAAAPAARTLRIESQPAGATVTEGALVLGKTPIDLPLDPAAGTRHLVVALDGYMPYAIAQEPAAENVKLLVPLVPAQRAPESKAPPTADAKPADVKTAAAKAPPPPRAPAPPPPKPSPGPPSDINMTR